MPQQTKRPARKRISGRASRQPWPPRWLAPGEPRTNRFEIQKELSEQTVLTEQKLQQQLGHQLGRGPAGSLGRGLGSGLEQQLDSEACTLEHELITPAYGPSPTCCHLASGPRNISYLQLLPCGGILLTIYSERLAEFAPGGQYYHRSTPKKTNHPSDVITGSRPQSKKHPCEALVLALDLTNVKKLPARQYHQP
jgi:hypothetical protein